MSNMWTAPEDDPRSESTPVGEKATYREYLGNYRLTIEMKCEGLDAGQLARRSVPPSTMSLLGLVRHLASVENHWFQRVLQGRADAPRLYKRDDDRDWDFTGAVADPSVVQDAFATWKAEIARAEEWLDAIAEDDLGREVPFGDGTVATRDVLVHMIEEYARHAGHADFLRECVDGRTGQLAPPARVACEGATYLRIDSIESAIISLLMPFQDNPVGYVVAGWTALAARTVRDTRIRA
jgi:uncharacterized damage-inducible protein DinB